MWKNFQGVSKFDNNPTETILNGLEQESSTRKLTASWASLIFETKGIEMQII